MSSADAAWTVTVLPEAALRETVKVAATVAGALPSFTVASVIARVGVASSSVIVACPWPSPIVAFAALLRLRKKVSSLSSSVSPCTVALTSLLVSPGRKVSVAVPLP